MGFRAHGDPNKHTGLVGTQHLTCAYGHLRERGGSEQGRKEEPSPSEEAVDRRLHGSGAGAVHAAAGQGGAAPRWGGARMLDLKWLEECCKPGVSSDSAWHTAPTDISLRAVTTQAIRLEYGTAPSKVCWSYCQPGVKLSAWNTAPQDIR